MKNILPYILILVYTSCFSQKTSNETFVCPPCANECDKLTFTQAGECPQCHMQLEKKASILPARKKAAILLFPGVQIIDFTGPYEVLGQSNFDVFTVAEDSVLTTNMGMKIKPNYTFVNCPDADVFVIPGGNVTPSRKNPKVVNWVKEYSNKTDIVMSVCTGALLLAETGLLNGKTATTFYGALSDLQKQFPQTNVVFNQRYVDNGKFITTAGLTSGMDGALHIIEKIYGKPSAQMVALNLEYNWRPKDNYVRASLADKHLDEIFEGEGHPSITSVNLLNTEGDADKWLMELEFAASGSAEELEKTLENLIIQKAGWKKIQNPSATRSKWSFVFGAEKWNAELKVSPIANSKTYKVTVEVFKMK